MLKHCEDGCVSLRQVHEWHKEFQSGASSLTDAPCPGRANTSTTPNTIPDVQRLIHGNRPVTIDEVVEELNISVLRLTNSQFFSHFIEYYVVS